MAKVNRDINTVERSFSDDRDTYRPRARPGASGRAQPAAPRGSAPRRRSQAGHAGRRPDGPGSGCPLDARRPGAGGAGARARPAGPLDRGSSFVLSRAPAAMPGPFFRVAHPGCLLFLGRLVASSRTLRRRHLVSPLRSGGRLPPVFAPGETP